MILLELLIGFLEIGLFSFGGAYGAIPLIRDVVLQFGWLEEEKLSYMIAVSESTPGPIMFNMATYVGSVKAGVPGAIVATLAVTLPAFLIVVLLTLLLKNLASRGIYKTVIGVLTACVTGMILATGVWMVLRCCFGGVTEFSPDYKAVILTIALTAVYLVWRTISKKRMSPILLICVAGAAGVLAYGW